MPKRTSSQQNKHDRKVRQIARALEQQGWAIQADLPNHDRPHPIGKNRHIPDIVAEKAGAQRIIEVETTETKEADKRQHETFRRSVARRKRASFQIEEA